MKNKKMKLARVECDLTQEQLAEKIGVTRQTIGLIESGKYNPTISLCIDICKALELCQRNSIIHRDIKPENMFISSVGDFKVKVGLVTGAAAV